MPFPLNFSRLIDRLGAMVSDASLCVGSRCVADSSGSTRAWVDITPGWRSQMATWLHEIGGDREVIVLTTVALSRPRRFGFEALEDRIVQIDCDARLATRGRHGATLAARALRRIGSGLA
jgi:hypothetical protein